ncbi:MAG: DUF916 and DUF3324 domain-containing protein, partial [Weissella cibaria]
MIRQIKGLLTLAIALVSLVTMSQVTASADGTMNYAVTPQLPDNQVDKTNGFFNIKLAAGEKQTLHVSVTNSSSKAITLNVQAGTAGTSQGGVVDNTLTGNDAKRAPYRADLLLKPSQTTIKVPANQTLDLPVDFTMPKDKVSGLIAGGLKLSQVDDNHAQTQQTTLQSKVAYVLAFVARQTETLPDPRLRYGGSKATQVDGQNAVQLQLNNDTGTFVNRLEVDATVLDPQNKKVVRLRQSMMQMAPTSTLNLPVLLIGKSLKSGTYHVKTTTYYSQNDKGKYKDSKGVRFNYKQTFNSKFLLTVAQADKLNRTDVIQRSSHALPL